MKNDFLSFLIALLCLVSVLACNLPTGERLTASATQPAVTVEPVSATLKPPTFTVTLTRSPTLTTTPTWTLTSSPSVTFTPTVTGTPTVTFTPSKLPPDYKYPRARVLEQANCRYGPGVGYLYKYGLYEGNRIEVIGRNELGNWAYIRGIGGTNPCWVSLKVLEMTDDIFSLPYITPVLPHSDIYGPPAVVSAVRNGNTVTVAWSAVEMTEDKYRGYLIEAWVCQGGKIVFSPARSDDLIYNYTDEAGCAEPSHGRIYTAEKHGYSDWKIIPWPAH